MDYGYIYISFTFTLHKKNNKQVMHDVFLPANQNSVFNVCSCEL